MEKTKRCPYCGEEILAVAKKCKHCGEWLDKDDPKKEAKKIVACPVCGEDIEDGTEVCPYCHERVNAGGDATDGRKKENKKIVACPVCGEDVEEGTEVCPYCHEHIGWDENAAHSRTSTASRAQAQQQGRQAVAQQPSKQAHVAKPVQQANNDKVRADVHGGDGGYDDITEYEDDDENEGLFKYYYFDVFFKHYADFQGKLPLKRFWLAYLFNVLCMLPFVSLDFAVFGFPMVFTTIYSLAVLVPSVAFAVRRLHDADKSGWYFLLGLIPFVGPIILIVFLCMGGEGQTGRVRAVTKDYILFAVIGVATLLFGIVGVATLDSKMKELENLIGGASPYTSVSETSSSDDESLAWGGGEAASDDGSSVSDADAVSMIEEFYRLYWNNDGDVTDDEVETYCTVRLQKKLQDAYEFECEGVPPYNTALFRSGAQDGVGESKLVNVESLGGGEYKVNLLDMGHECEMRIKVVNEDGRPMMDDVECASVNEHW